MTRITFYRLLVVAAAVLALEVLCLTGVIDKLTMQPPHRILIPRVNRESVQRVGRIRDHQALADHLRRLADDGWVGVVGVEHPRAGVDLDVVVFRVLTDRRGLMVN